MGQILKENAYLRIQGKLTDDMDDTSQTNVRALRLFAEGLARDHAKELEDFAELLLPAEGT